VILRGHLGKLVEYSFAKECLCSGDAAIRPKQRIHRLAKLVDRAI
jgi:hypothetical protein